MISNEIVDVVPGPNCDLTEESLEQAIVRFREWANSKEMLGYFANNLPRIAVSEYLIFYCKNEPPSIKYLESYVVPVTGYKSGYKESLYMCYCRGCKLMARYFEGIGYFEIGSRKFRRIITKNGRFAKRK